MSMSTYVLGFKPVDKKWQEMKAVWDACRAAKVEIPKDVDIFFNYKAPDNAGVEIELHKIAKEWQDEHGGRSGLEIDITKLPKDVKIIRFINSW